jgi:hypothetical protein
MAPDFSEKKFEGKAAGGNVGLRAGRALWRQASCAVVVTTATLVTVPGVLLVPVGADASALRNAGGTVPASQLLSASPQTDDAPVIIDSSGRGYVTWATPASKSSGQGVWFCRVPKGGTCTDPVRLAVPRADSLGITEPFPVFGKLAGVVHVVGRATSTATRCFGARRTGARPSLM